VAGFGDQDLIVDTRICGSLSVKGVVALPALYPRLGLLIGCALTEITDPKYGGPPLKDMELVAMTGEMRLAEHGRTVGLLHWIGQDRNHRCRSYSHPSEDQLLLACDLDPWRLERIERARDGAEPVFWLQLWPVILMQGRRVLATVHVIRVPIPRDRWLEFLNGVGYGSFDVVEIRMSSELGMFRRASEHLRNARHQMNEGHFDDAALRCRKAIEAFFGEAQLPRNADELKIRLETYVPKRRAGAYGAIFSRLKEAASLGQHDLGYHPPLSRPEARFILRATEDLVSLLGELIAHGTSR